MFSTLLQACEPRVRVLQSAVFIHPPQQPRRRQATLGEPDNDEGDLSYLTGAAPTSNDELVRGVVDVYVPSDRTVTELRVRLRADQVVSILDTAALTVPVSWEQSVVFDRTLTFPPRDTSLRPRARSRSQSRNRLSLNEDRLMERSRSRSALRSLVRSSHRSRSRHGRQLNDVAEVDVSPEQRGRYPRRLPGHSRPSVGAASESRGRSIAVRPAGAPAPALRSGIDPTEDTSSSALSTTPGSDSAGARGRRSSTPDSSAPEADGPGFSRIESSPAPAVPSWIRRDTSSSRGGVRSLSLGRLRRRDRPCSTVTPAEEEGKEEERGDHPSTLFSGLFHHHDKGKARNSSREASLRISREPSAIPTSSGLRDSSPTASRHSIVRAAESDSECEPGEDGLFLTKGVHAFEFAFILPSDVPPYERSIMGRVKWTIRATIVGGGRARSNVEDSAEIYPIVVPTPDHFFATPLSILYHDLHPSLGLLSVSLTSSNISVGGIMNIDIHSPQPPVDMAVYLARVTLETSIELETRRKGKQKVPVQRHRLYEQGWVPPKPGSANKLGEGDPVQGWIRHPGTDHAWSVQTTVRLPGDNLIRATTMPGSNAAIRFSHNLLVEIVHSRDPAIDAWLAAGDLTVPMPQPVGGEHKIKVFALRQPAIIPSCCVAYNAATLPRYTTNPTQHISTVADAHHEQTHCVCGISMAELTAQEEALLPPGLATRPAGPQDVPGDVVHNYGKVGELPPDWTPPADTPVPEQVSPSLVNRVPAASSSCHPTASGLPHPTHSSSGDPQTGRCNPLAAEFAPAPSRRSMTSTSPTLGQTPQTSSNPASIPHSRLGTLPTQPALTQLGTATDEVASFRSRTSSLVSSSSGQVPSSGTASGTALDVSLPVTSTLTSRSISTGLPPSIPHLTSIPLPDLPPSYDSLLFTDEQPAIVTEF